MIAFVALTLLSLLIASTFGASDVLGSHLFLQYTLYNSMPLNRSHAVQLGWSATNGTCVPGIGTLYYQKGVATTAYPLGIAFNPFNGEITGLQVAVTEAVPTPLVQAGWWLTSANSSLVPQGFKAFITIGTRSLASSCGKQPATGDLGDRLIVNPLNAAIPIPLTTTDAVSAGYANGSCFDSMGWHAFRDIAAQPNQLTWNANTLTPVVPMYDGSRINAIFVTVPFVQNGFFATNMWDPVPLLNTFMCKNFCSSQCTFANTYIFQTMHIFFRDYKKVTCPHGCTIGCCQP
jgi:hypothetical protein